MMEIILRCLTGTVWLLGRNTWEREQQLSPWEIKTLNSPMIHEVCLPVLIKTNARGACNFYYY